MEDSKVSLPKKFTPIARDTSEKLCLRRSLHNLQAAQPAVV